MKLSRFRHSKSRGERDKLARIRYLLEEPGILHGSLQVNRRRCGKAGCHCIDGEPHASLQLRVVQDGKQVSVHVPASWEKRVRNWLEKDREIRSLLSELSDHYAARLRRRKE